MKQSVFISYRRADTSGHAGRISDDLERHFRSALVFRDIDSIDAGADFVHSLERAIAAAKVCLVLIGDTWLDVRADDGSRRLDAPDDHVRREIETALADEDLLVVPVLVEGATMPEPAQLPASLQRLARLHAVELSESRWDYDIGRLAGVLRAAGVESAPRAVLPRWSVALLLVLLCAVAAMAWCCLRGASVDDFAGLWYLPNGGQWTVRERDQGLWVEEMHHQSREVWKRGPATVDGDELNVSLELVFDREPFRYLHRLRLSDDGRSLIGSVRRSDRQQERSVVLTRSRQ